MNASIARRWFGLALAAVVTIAPACGADDAGTTGPTDEADGAQADGAGTDPDSEGATADAADGAVTTADVDDAQQQDDVATASDVADVAADAAKIGDCPGGSGCACTDNGNCDNGLCIEDPGAAAQDFKVCATKCTEDCQPGYRCVQTSSGSGDSVSICVASWGRLCNPCTETKECDFVGTSGAACVAQAGLGNFCGSPCSKDTDCPDTYACQEVSSVEGNKSSQCVKKNDADDGAAFGFCDCSPQAVAQQLATACSIQHKDADGKIVGTCAGTRACLTGGLAKCTAPAIASEVCDGADNDCDGETDEAACDDNNTCTTDSCDSAKSNCVHTPLGDGLACDADGSACTENDSCQTGTCTPGKVLNCDDKNPCTKDTCDLATGCTQVSADGLPCDDENPCTVGDLCQQNACKPGPPKQCSSGDPCIAASCNVLTGSCKFSNAFDGIKCEDGNKCTTSDTCKAGSCAAGGLIDCDDANACTKDACDPNSGCAQTAADGGECEADGDKCTVGEICKGGSCAGGTKKSCDDKESCTVDSCNSGTGDCAHDALAKQGNACDDGDACTTKDVCKAGKCAVEQLDCDDKNACTVDACDPTTGKCGHDANKADGITCDADGSPCTVKDVCKAGTCTAGAGLVCNDPVGPCQLSSCEVVGGAPKCVTKAKAAGTACDDGDKCTEKDNCQVGLCEGVTRSCDDGNVCTDDSCNKLSGCQFAGNVKPCVDSDECTIKEQCSNNSCQKQPLTCSDGNPCTQDKCDAAKGCDYPALKDETVCDGDGKKWCSSGECIDSPTANKKPIAKLVCPATGNVGDTLTADATGSSDPDGTIASYLFDVDGFKLPKPSGKVATQYSDPGKKTITVLVTDNKGATAQASCEILVDKPNTAPVAKLVCPATAIKGDEIVLNAGGSTDADGKIVEYAFTYGDGGADKLPTATAKHKYVKEGEVKATVVVTDDGGKTAQATCTITVTPESAPTVKFIKPAGDTSVSQGHTVDFEVQATAKPGKSISSVQMFVDGKSIGIDADPPFTFSHKIPEATKTGTKIIATAKATDIAAIEGSAPPLTLTVKNDPPKAVFVATIAGPQRIDVDASGCTDAEEPSSKLLVRFDWEGDGGWDTQWSTVKAQTHTYNQFGTYTVKMEVKDNQGQIDGTSRTVTINSLKQVSGPLTKDEVWTGTIVVTGDITVPKGITLTIQAGTQVLFVPLDSNNDQIGDFDIWVYGKLQVLGLQVPGKEVLFSRYGPAKQKIAEWGRIQLKGEGSKIQAARIEFAQYGVEVMDKSIVDHTTFSDNQYAVVLRKGADATLNAVTATKSLADGILIEAGAIASIDAATASENGTNGLRITSNTTATKVAIKGSTFAKNAEAGIRVDSSAASMALTLDGNTISENKDVGVLLNGGVAGAITHNQISANGYEGLRAMASGSYQASVVVNYNNIWGNATVGSLGVAAVSLHVGRHGSGSGWFNSPVWSAPGGAQILAIRYTYWEGANWSGNYGYIRKDSTGGTVLVSQQTSITDQWLDVSKSNVTKFVIQAYKGTSSSSSSYYLDMYATAAIYAQKGVKKQVTVLLKSGTLDLKHNYLGAFPDVLAVVGAGNPGMANVEGFVGTKFGATWQKECSVGGKTQTCYFGGETATNGLAWDGEVWVTGDVLVPEGKALTIAAGTTVHVVKLDANADGTGDIDIVVDGDVVALGTADKPITVTELGGAKKPGSWGSLNARKGKSTIAYLVSEYGTDGLVLGAGTVPHVLKNVTLRNNKRDGLRIVGAKDISITGLKSQDNGGAGVYVDGSSLLLADGMVATGNTGHGVHVYNSKTNLTIKNLTSSGNGQAGLLSDRGTVAVAQCLLSGNGVGAWYTRDSAGTLTSCDVKHNLGEGVRLTSESSLHPNPVINDNNIMRNSLAERPAIGAAATSAVKTGYGSGYLNGKTWTSPLYDEALTANCNNTCAQPGQAEACGKCKADKHYNLHAEIAALEMYYVEYANYSGNYGRILKDNSSGAQLIRTDTNLARQWVAVTAPGITAIMPQVYKGTSSSSYYAQLYVYQAMYTARQQPLVDGSGGVINDVDGKPKLANPVELSAITSSGTVDCKKNYWGTFQDIDKRLVQARTNSVDYTSFVLFEKQVGPK